MIAWFLRDIWHKYHSWYFKIVSNFTRLTAREITHNNFELSLVVFMPNITTNHAISCTNHFSILVILWPITWPYTAITFFLIAFSNYNVVLILSLKNVLFCVKSTEIEKTFFRVRTDLKSSWIFNKSLKSPWISSRVYPWKSSHFEKENFRNIRISYLTVAGIPNL